MKQFFVCIAFLLCIQAEGYHPGKEQTARAVAPVQNLFIITIDGFRWQEIFSGADSLLINNDKYCPDPETMNLLYWCSDPQERRKKLMPFFWNVLAKKGQVYGNRKFDNKVNMSNFYTISYPGYNEMLTGNTDVSISSNKKYVNPNLSILEYLNNKESFKGNVVAFTSWDVFPFILNKERSGLYINSGYENISDDHSGTGAELINRVQEKLNDEPATRQDELTFLAAKDYIRKNQPRVLYLGFGETDEAAHHSRYDIYLEKAGAIDKMLGELWHLVQSTPGYKDNTTFIITTDHGRGSKSSQWTDHGIFIKGSSQTWLAVAGPNISAVGEVQGEAQIYGKQIAQTIAALLGEDFKAGRDVAAAIQLK